MTLREALDALHRAGRIRSPWLPGMRTTQYGVGTRLCWFEAETYDGPRWNTCGDNGAWLRFRGDRMATLDIDIDDPATCGCLSALAREASGDPYLVSRVEYRHPMTGALWEDERLRWCIPHIYRTGWPSGETAWVCRHTEGAAWETVIIAMAEAL